MKFSKYITYLKEIILETKFVFSKPKKTQVLLYDQGTKFNEQIKKTLKKKSVSILYARLEEINLYPHQRCSFMVLVSSILCGCNGPRSGFLVLSGSIPMASWLYLFFLF